MSVHIPDGKQDPLDLPPSTYNLTFSRDGRQILYAITEGVGWGSELWTARADGGNARRLIQDRTHLIAFPHFSPDTAKFGFVLMNDDTQPFSVGGLWVGDVDGSNLRRLADVDAGHGFAPVWSPDGRWIAYVGRENPHDDRADFTFDSLESNLYAASSVDGTIRALSSLEHARVGPPAWSPDGSLVAFPAHDSSGDGVWTVEWGNGELTKVVDSPGSFAPGWIAGE